MTYVIAETCLGTCDTACVEVCPVDCIHGPVSTTGAGDEVSSIKDEAERKAFAEGKQLYINPEECIDCGVCEPECPVSAIFPEDELPDDQAKYLQINTDFFL